jgi:hypothetical protein
MFTHLSGWKSRVEIDQRAREGRLRQEWREAPHENDRVSIRVTFWSVLGLLAQSVESLLKPPHSLGCFATQSRPITIRFRRGSKQRKAFCRYPPGGAAGVSSPERVGADARLDASIVQILTRRGDDWTDEYPTIAKAIAGLPTRNA